MSDFTKRADENLVAKHIREIEAFSQHRVPLERVTADLQGQITTVRKAGKSLRFFQLQDPTGSIQILALKKALQSAMDLETAPNSSADRFASLREVYGFSEDLWTRDIEPLRKATRLAIRGPVTMITVSDRRQGDHPGEPREILTVVLSPNPISQKEDLFQVDLAKVILCGSATDDTSFVRKQFLLARLRRKVERYFAERGFTEIEPRFITPSWPAGGANRKNNDKKEYRRHVKKGYK